MASTVGHGADGRVDRVGLVRDALEDPLEHPRVLAVAGPQERAVRVLAEPVHVEDLRAAASRSGASAPMLQPVGEVVGHVVAAERQHGEGVAAQVAHGAGRGRRRLGRHDRAEEHPVLPVVGLEDQRHDRGAPAAEQDGARSARPSGSSHSGAMAGSCAAGVGEAGVRVGGRRARLGRPVLALPVGQVGRGLVGHALPPDVAVVGEGGVGEDGSCRRA